MQKCGANAVKFQTYKLRICDDNVDKANYQKSSNIESQYQMLKNMSWIIRILWNLNNMLKIDIDFLTTIADKNDLDFNKRSWLQTIKIGSSDLTTFNYFYTLVCQEESNNFNRHVHGQRDWSRFIYYLMDIIKKILNL